MHPALHGGTSQAEGWWSRSPECPPGPCSVPWGRLNETPGQGTSPAVLLCHPWTSLAARMAMWLVHISGSSGLASWAGHISLVS